LQEELRLKLKYVSIHPLFGPDIRSLRGRNIIVVRGGDERSSRTVAEYFRDKGSNVTFLSVEEHDKLMATLQVMHHFMLISFHETFKKRVMKTRALEGLLPEALKLTLRTASRIMGNIDTVMEIQKLNPYAHEARRAYARSLLTLAEKLTRKSE
jgi:prephenate dehydrogenase